MVTSDVPNGKAISGSGTCGGWTSASAWLESPHLPGGGGGEQTQGRQTETSGRGQAGGDYSRERARGELLHGGGSKGRAVACRKQSALPATAAGWTSASATAPYPPRPTWGRTARAAPQCLQGGRSRGGKVAGQAETSQTLHAKSKYSWEERRRELLPLPLAEHAQLPCSCRAPHLKTS